MFVESEPIEHRVTTREMSPEMLQALLEAKEFKNEPTQPNAPATQAP